MKKFYILMTLGLLTSLSQLHAQKFSTDLIAHYPFNGNATDASGNGHDVTSNSATLTTDKFGYADAAYNFSGSSMTIPNDAQFLEMNDGFTISMWVYPTTITGGEQVFISKLQSSDRELVWRTQSSKLHSHFNSGGLKFCTTDSAVLSTNEWQFLSLVWDGTSMHHFMDGELKQTCAHDGQNINFDGGTWRIGALTQSGEFFTGKIDEVKMYGRAFTPSEVGELYTLENMKEGLVAGYTFNDNLIDASVNSNDATLLGGDYVNDRFGNIAKALYFDGIDDIATIPQSDSTQIQYPLTMSAWIWMEDTIEQARVYTNCNNNSRYYGVNFGAANGQIICSIMDGRGFGSQFRRTARGAMVMKAQEWHHILVIVNGPTDMELYVDGIQDTPTYSGSGTSTIGYTSTDDGAIGGWDLSPTVDGYFWNGAVDDLFMWDRELSEAERGVLFEEGTTNDLGMLTGIFNSQSSTKVDFTLFPNPAAGFAMIQSEKAVDFIELRQLDGTLVSKVNPASSNRIALNNIENGLYVVHIRFADGTLGTQPLSVVN